VAEQYFTIEHVAQRLHVSKATVWRLIRLGGLPVVELNAGGLKPVRRVRETDLEAWAAEGRRAS